MTTLTFQNTTLSVIDQNNQKWIPALEVGRALDYKNPSSDIAKLYERNKDEFTSSMTAIIDMDTTSGIQKVRIFSLRGCWLLGMRSHTKVAKDFRKWVLDILDREISQNEQQIAPITTTLTPKEQNMVQNAVKSTHERTGLSYAEIWSRTKNKFNVAKYQQIESSQLREVLIYIASMSATRTAGQNDIIIPIELFDAIMKHSRLAKQLAEQTELFHRQLFIMLGIEPRIRNNIAALSYDVAHEFNPWLKKGEELLANHCYLALPN